jgi:hypothetical protein
MDRVTSVTVNKKWICLAAISVAYLIVLGYRKSE